MQDTLYARWSSQVKSEQIASVEQKNKKKAPIGHMNPYRKNFQ
jgi:hypothetical protein